MCAGALAGGAYLWFHESVAAVVAKTPDVKVAAKRLDIALPGQPATALVVGYDQRKGVDKGIQSRSDTVMLVRADPQTDSVSLLSFPRDLIVDGEVIALRADGSPHPFQVTMQRFGRKLDVDRLRAEIPLTPFLFDCLYADGESLIDTTQDARVARLGAIAPSIMVPRLVRPTSESAARFLDETLRRGHEGLMVKSLAAPYAAGRRGQQWLKVKIARTLDLVILAAEWGHGRRTGWLSNLHLGARHGETFVMLGKTFKGLTDELLTWQTGRFLELEAHRDAYTVYVRPELVVEIAFNDVQESPHYPGGLALRFARVKGYRPDKSASEADTLATVQDIYRQQSGNEPPVPRLDV